MGGGGGRLGGGGGRLGARAVARFGRTKRGEGRGTRLKGIVGDSCAACPELCRVESGMARVSLATSLDSKLPCDTPRLGCFTSTRGIGSMICGSANLYHTKRAVWALRGGGGSADQKRATEFRVVSGTKNPQGRNFHLLYCCSLRHGSTRGMLPSCNVVENC